MRTGVGPVLQGGPCAETGGLRSVGHGPEVDILATVLHCPLNEIGIRRTVLDQENGFCGHTHLLLVSILVRRAV